MLQHSAVAAAVVAVERWSIDELISPCEVAGSLLYFVLHKRAHCLGGGEGCTLTDHWLDGPNTVFLLSLVMFCCP